MAESRFCSLARKNAVGHDAPSRELIALLKPPVHRSEVKKIYRRSLALKSVFVRTDATQAFLLLRRLEDKRDALGRFFLCRLATAERNRLKRILRAKAKKPSFSPSSPANSRTTGPLNQGVDNRGTQTPATKDPGINNPKTNPPPAPPPTAPKRPRRIVTVLPPLPPGRYRPTGIISLVRQFYDALKDSGVPEKSIEALKKSIEAAEFILNLPGVKGLVAYFAFELSTGRLLQVRVITNLRLQRILFRAERDLKKLQRELKTLHNLYNDPQLRSLLKQQQQKPAQPRDSRGRFKKKPPNHSSPGSTHEKNVCDRVRQKYPLHAEQVKVQGLGKPVGMPGQTPPPGLVPQGAIAHVDCAAARTPNGRILLFEAKDSGPADFTNPGLTKNQKIAYPKILASGGIIVRDKGPFRANTRLPRGTRVKIITPRNIGSI